MDRKELMTRMGEKQSPRTFSIISEKRAEVFFKEGLGRKPDSGITRKRKGRGEEIEIKGKGGLAKQ